MPYLETAVTILGLIALGWVCDLATGRRSLPNMILVSACGGAAGSFLALRVFSVSEVTSWTWPACAALGAIFSLLIYFLFRNKR